MCVSLGVRCQGLSFRNYPKDQECKNLYLNIRFLCHFTAKALVLQTLPLLSLICSQQLIRLILHLCPAQCTHTWLLQLLSAGELVLWRRARTALADEPGLRKTVCVCGGNVRVAEGIDSLPSSAPFLSLHPVVGDGSLKMGSQRPFVRSCFVGFCV